MTWRDNAILLEPAQSEAPSDPGQTWRQQAVPAPHPTDGQSWRSNAVPLTPPRQEEPAAEQTGPRNYDLAEIPGRWKETMGPSLWKAGTQYANAFLHPIQTAQTAGAAGMGLGADIAAAPERGARWAAEKVLTAIGADEAAQNLKQAPLGGMTQARAAMREAFPAAAQASDAVIDNYVEAYGGWENFKRTLAEDPVRVFQDAAALATAGGWAAKEMGLTRTGQALTVAGKAGDPIWIGEKVAKGVAKATGVGAKAIGGPIMSGRSYESMTGLVAGTEAAPHSKLIATIKETAKLPADEMAALAIDNIGHALGKGVSIRSALGAGAIGYGVWAEALGPAAGVLMAATSPAVMGEAAWTAGRIKTMIVQPIIAAERAMRSVGIAPRAVAITAEQTGRAQAQLEENRNKLTGTISAKAQELGYKMHARVINKIADQLLSEDPEVYRRGIDALAKNKRMSEIVTKIGDDAIAEQKKVGGQ